MNDASGCEDCVYDESIAITRQLKLLNKSRKNMNEAFSDVQPIRADVEQTSHQQRRGSHRQEYRAT